MFDFMFAPLIAKMRARLPTVKTFIITTGEFLPSACTASPDSLIYQAGLQIATRNGTQHSAQVTQCSRQHLLCTAGTCTLSEPLSSTCHRAALRSCCWAMLHCWQLLRLQNSCSPQQASLAASTALAGCQVA